MERILSKFGTKQLWFHVTQFFSRCGRTEREQEKSLDSSTFLDLILTQGRKFEDIKTNVTRNILGTEPRRKCQELNCRNITKVKIDRNSIHFSNSRTRCNSGIIKGQTFEISSRISNTPITTFGKKNNNLNSDSFRSRNRDGV